MTDTIKITTLSQMGTTVPGPTLVPVVDMSGVPTTKKATIANIANAILSEAGNGYAYAAKANLANTAGSAGTVSSASQPNITSVGTLTALTVSGTTNLGAVGNVIISGGTVGQVLTTNGSNVLSWTTVASGNNDPAGSNTQVQFNDGDAFGATANLVFDKTTNNLTLAGNVIAQYGVYSNIISSIGNTSNIEIWVDHPNGFPYVFTIGGAFELPGGHFLETYGDGSFEIKSGNGIVISSDIANTNQHFTFRTDGVFHAPANVVLEGTRLSIGPGAANVALSSPTVVINANSNVYVQAALTNENANGSADWVAYGTNGNDAGGWTDFGFTGYNFNDANYTITGPGDGYLFAHAYANGAGGGSLILATGDHGTQNDIIFATNGFAAANEFGRISHDNNSLELTRAGATITFPDSTEQSTAFTGNIAAANVTGLGNIATSNLDGSTSNVLYGNGAFAAVPATAAAGSNGEIQFNISGAFASTGNLTFVDGVSGGTLEIGPPGAMQLDGNGTIVANSLESASDVYIYAANGIVDLRATGNIVLKSDNANYEWVFDDNGNLTLPGNTFAVNYANGAQVSISGANTGNVTFDDVTVQGVNGLNLSAGADFTANLAYLQVRAGDVASHIHLDTGNNEAYDLIVGDDQNYVQVSSTGNILLSSYDSNTDQYIWTLDYNGNLILAGGNSVIQSIANSSLDPTLPNVSTMVFTPDANYNSQILVLDPTAPGHIHLRAYAFSNIDEPAANIFLGGEDTAFEITSGANNEARVHSGGNTWTFGNDGILTFPGTPRIDTDSDNFEVQAAENINFEANAVVNIYTDSGNNAYQWQFGDDGNLTLPDTTSVIANASIILEANSTGNITGLSVNGDADANLYAHGNVTIVSDSSNTTATWSFGSNGNLTLPANTFAINYANGTQVSLGGGSNIANGNSNVSIATANGNVTISAVGNTTMTVTGTGANITGTLTSTGKIGYASGSTVTQLTSRGTGVTINALAGTIVTTSAAMVATEIDTFSVVNSSVDPNNDIVLVQIVSPNQGTYDCIANPAVIGGFNDGFYINIVNISGFTTSDETITIRFMVIKSPNA